MGSDVFRAEGCGRSDSSGVRAWESPPVPSERQVDVHDGVAAVVGLVMQVVARRHPLMSRRVARCLGVSRVASQGEGTLDIAFCGDTLAA